MGLADFLQGVIAAKKAENLNGISQADRIKIFNAYPIEEKENSSDQFSEDIKTGTKYAREKLEGFISASSLSDKDMVERVYDVFDNLNGLLLNNSDWLSDPNARNLPKGIEQQDVLQAYRRLIINHLANSPTDKNYKVLTTALHTINDSYQSLPTANAFLAAQQLKGVLEKPTIESIVNTIINREQLAKLDDNLQANLIKAISKLVGIEKLDSSITQLQSATNLKQLKTSLKALQTATTEVQEKLRTLFTSTMENPKFDQDEFVSALQKPFAEMFVYEQGKYSKTHTLELYNEQKEKLRGNKKHSVTIPKPLKKLTAKKVNPLLTAEQTSKQTSGQTTSPKTNPVESVQPVTAAKSETLVEALIRDLHTGNPKRPFDNLKGTFQTLAEKEINQLKNALTNESEKYSGLPDDKLKEIYNCFETLMHELNQNTEWINYWQEPQDHKVEKKTAEAAYRFALIRNSKAKLDLQELLQQMNNAFTAAEATNPDAREIEVRQKTNKNIENNLQKKFTINFSTLTSIDFIASTITTLTQSNEYKLLGEVRGKKLISDQLIELITQKLAGVQNSIASQNFSAAKTTLDFTQELVNQAKIFVAANPTDYESIQANITKFANEIAEKQQAMKTAKKPIEPQPVIAQPSALKETPTTLLTTIINTNADNITKLQTTIPTIKSIAALQEAQQNLKKYRDEINSATKQITITPERKAELIKLVQNIENLIQQQKTKLPDTERAALANKEFAALRTKIEGASLTALMQYRTELEKIKASIDFETLKTDQKQSLQTKALEIQEAITIRRDFLRDLDSGSKKSEELSSGLLASIKQFAKISVIDKSHHITKALIAILKDPNNAETSLNEFFPKDSVTKVKLLEIAKTCVAFKSNQAELRPLLNNVNSFNTPLFSTDKCNEILKLAAKLENPLLLQMLFDGRLSDEAFEGEKGRGDRSYIDWINSYMQGNNPIFPAMMTAGFIGSAEGVKNYLTVVFPGISEKNLKLLEDERARQQLIRGSTITNTDLKEITNTDLKEIAINNPAIKITDWNTVTQINKMTNAFLNEQISANKFITLFAKQTGYLLTPNELAKIAPNHMLTLEQLAEKLPASIEQLQKFNVSLQQKSQPFLQYQQELREDKSKINPAITETFYDNIIAFRKNIEETVLIAQQNRTYENLAKLATKNQLNPNNLTEISLLTRTLKLDTLTTCRYYLTALATEYKQIKQEIHSIKTALKEKNFPEELSRLTNKLLDYSEQLTRLTQKAESTRYAVNPLGTSAKTIQKTVGKFTESIAEEQQKISSTLDTTIKKTDALNASAAKPSMPAKGLQFVQKMKKLSKSPFHRKKTPEQPHSEEGNKSSKLTPKGNKRN